MPLDIVLLGPPGAGKGTQARRIAGDYGIPVISTGDMLRAAMAADTGLGRRIRPIYDQGNLVPDELVIDLIRERLLEADAATGALFDGFPRNLPQAEALDGVLDEAERRLAVVFEFQVPDPVAEQRLLERAHVEGRSDDTPAVARHRLSVFHADTEPVIEYYRARGILVGIHADRSIGEVFAELRQVLDELAQPA
ncbi:MAG: adenylate kinase [Actinobacteria bacterium]|nr:adenylate kinase [Actinomycetota bacterium]